MSDCPTPAQLERLLADALPGPEAQAVEAHVEACPACQQALEQLTGASHLPGGPAQSPDAHPGGGGPVADLVRRMEQVPAPGAAAGTVETLPGPPDSTATAAYEPGRRARYAVVRLHARGGIGAVWVARDEELGREVALKELRDEQAGSPAALARFLGEARVTGQLEHPGIVPVYELAGAAGRPFYTMRLLRGRTLGEAAAAYHRARQEGRAGPLDLRQLLTAFVGVCNAVAYAHSRGVLHRDLKPHNVVLGDFGEAVVLDWGLAKVLGDADGGPGGAPVQPAAVADQTAQGQVLGTPAYMAPEQAEGRLDQIDRRTDVYGLGAVLYEVLTGQPPFAGPDAVAVLRQVLHEPPLPPRQLVPTTPAALEAVCLKALARKREGRYATAGEVAREVERWLADEPVAAYPEPWRLRARRWLARHRTLTATAAAAVLVATASLAVATALLQAANDRERRSRARAEDNFKLAHDAVDKYFTRVSESEKLKAHGLEGLRRDLLQDARDFYERFLQEQGDNPGLRDERAGAYYRLAKISADLGATADADRSFEQALALLEGLVQDHPADPEYQHKLAGILQNYAVLQARTGRSSGAGEAFTKARAIRERLARDYPESEPYREGLARTLNDMAIFYATTNRRAEAGAVYERALAVQEELVGAHPQNPGYRERLAGTLYSLGLLYRGTGRPAEALAAHEKSRDARARLVDEFPAVPRYQDRLARSLIEVGDLYFEASRTDRAKAAWEQAAALFGRLAHDHPEVPEYQDGQARSVGNLGLLAWRAGDPARSQSYFEQLLDIYERLCAAHPDFHEYQSGRLNTFLNLGDLLRSTGRLARSEECLAKAVPLAERLAAGHPEILPYQAQRTTLRLDLLATRACRGRHAASTAEAEALLKGPNLSAQNRYVAACVYALASGAARKDERLTAAERDRLAGDYGARAVALLKQAVAQGYLDAENLARDTDLDPIRSRPDFDRLRRELAERLNARGKGKE
jgi:serine/threonine protein kinase